MQKILDMILSQQPDVPVIIIPRRQDSNVKMLDIQPQMLFCVHSRQSIRLLTLGLMNSLLISVKVSIKLNIIFLIVELGKLDVSEIILSTWVSAFLYDNDRC